MLSIGFKNLLKKSKVCVLFKIDIITEKITTNPPINNIVLIELEILFPIIPPKSDNLIILFVFKLEPLV